MTAEQEARQRIDHQLEQCGWAVQDYRAMNISAGVGVAVREFPLSTGEADYMLYADGKALPEQRQIVAEVDQRLSVADEAEQQIERLLHRAARLRQSILKRAFEGKLVPQDPNDEPASALLERSRANRSSGVGQTKSRVK